MMKYDLTGRRSQDFSTQGQAQTDAPAARNTMASLTLQDVVNLMTRNPHHPLENKMTDRHDNWTPPAMDNVVPGFGAPVADPDPFFDRIKAFNQMYGMAVASRPMTSQLGVPVLQRLEQFQKMIEDEVSEGREIIAAVRDAEDPWHPDEVELLTNLADWLGDMVVYCASEATKYGIPLEKVLHVIMDSNASKLGADGKPIIVDGKLQKGPNYWKPEPKIRELLLEENRK